MTKTGLRKTWFQVHKWIGLILAVLIIPLSLTGSALVWDEPIQRMLHPERFAVSGPVALPVGAYADAAKQALHDGELLSRIDLPGKAGEPVAASAVKQGKGMPQRVTLFLDPANARVLGVERSGEGIFRLFHNIHGQLLVPGVGRAIVGWIGAAMLISSLTGLWLWWPLSGSFARGLRWKRHRNTDTNLHHLLGFWVSVPLFVLSLTGVWIAAPQMLPGQGGGPRPPRPAPLAEVATPVAAAVEHARAAAPGEVRSIGWPTDARPVWSVAVGRATVEVGDADGVARVAPRAPEQPETLARTMRRIHDGTGMGFVWQLILFLGGIIPAALAVTGIIMWWRARSWRGRVAQRRQAA